MIPVSVRMHLGFANLLSPLAVISNVGLQFTTFGGNYPRQDFQQIESCHFQYTKKPQREMFSYAAVSVSDVFTSFLITGSRDVCRGTVYSIPHATALFPAELHRYETKSILSDSSVELLYRDRTDIRNRHKMPRIRDYLIG